MRHPTLGYTGRRRLSIAQFGGVDVSSPPDRVADDRLSDVLNFRERDGRLCTRPALQYHDHIPVGSVQRTVPLGNATAIDGSGWPLLLQGDGTLVTGTQKLRASAFTVPSCRDADGIATVYDNGTVYALGEDGTCETQEPYIPTVLTAGRPTTAFVREQSGARLDSYNLLTGKSRCRYTSDGAGLYYWLPDDLTPDLTQEFIVKHTMISGAEITHKIEHTATGWKEVFDLPEDMYLDQLALNYDPTARCFWFTHADVGGLAPAGNAGIANNVELLVTRVQDNVQDEVYGMGFGMWFGGASDGLAGGTRLFLGGHRTKKNLIRWSALNDPLYFPENNYAYVGDASSAVTAFGKQSDMLVIFKEREVYATQYRAGSTVTAEQLLAGAVTDTQATAALFPIQQIHPEVGCDCPHTVRLCGDRLVWLCSDGRVYGLFSDSSYSRRVRAVSRPVEAELAQFDDEALSTASAVCRDGQYLLQIGGTVYALTADTLTAQSPSWYIWDITVPDIRKYCLTAVCSAVFVLMTRFDGTVYVLGLDDDAPRDRIPHDGRVIERDIPCHLCTKWYELGAPEQYKQITDVRLWVTGDEGTQVQVSLHDGRVHGTPLAQLTLTDDAHPRRIGGLSRVRQSGIALHSTGRMTLDRVEITYRRMGEIRE